MKKITFLRRISQAFFFLLFVFILWTTTYPLKSFLPASTFFVFNPLIMIITAISERIWLNGLALGALMPVGTLALGRFFCGWICPLGATFDAAACLRPQKRKEKPLGAPGRLRVTSIKFILLGILFGGALLGFQWAWVLDPMVIMARFVSLNLIPAVTLALNNVFILLIKISRFHGPLVDLYRDLKDSLLGIPVYYFSHSSAILALFLLIISSVFWVQRFWCRALCPLGALYAGLARFAPLRRSVNKCARCLSCFNDCRMKAIRADLSYDQSECILCMDCLYDCVGNRTRFRFEKPARPSTALDQKGAISRRNFLLMLGLAVGALGFKRKEGSKALKSLLRPPGSLPEEDFLDRCVRCGNCMKVCITNGLQPVLWEAGWEGLWTPQLIPEIGYCEYNCTLCGEVCPTQAIARVSLEDKHRGRIGRAVIDQTICIPWATGGSCLVCEEHCPVFAKAIKIIDDQTGILKPQVDKDLCVGCGICQNKCPVGPARAIKVYPLIDDRNA